MGYTVCDQNFGDAQVFITKFFEYFCNLGIFTLQQKGASKCDVTLIILKVAVKYLLNLNCFFVFFSGLVIIIGYWLFD